MCLTVYTLTSVIMNNIIFYSVDQKRKMLESQSEQIKALISFNNPIPEIINHEIAFALTI